MAALRAQMGATSLADFIRDLVEGETCPCCGLALTAGRSAREAGTVRCAACGCEVVPEEWPAGAAGGHGFYLAA